MNRKNRLSRRDFFKVAGAGLTATVIASCAQPATAPPAPTEVPGATAASQPAQASAAPAAKEPVTVNFQSDWMTQMKPKPIWIYFIDAFTAKNPDIKIEWNQTPATMEDVLTSLAGGRAPDCIHSHTGSLASVTTLAPRGYALVLDDLIKSSSINLDDYLPEQWATCKYVDKTYALPVTEGGPVGGMEWHQHLFEAIGHDPSAAPKDWAEIQALNDKLTTFDSSGAIDVLGFDPLANWGSWSPGWSFIGNVPLISEDKKTMMFDQPKWAEMLTFIGDTYKKLGPEKVKGYRTRWSMWTSSDKSGISNAKEAMMMTGYFAPGELSTTMADKSWKMGYGWIPTFGENLKSIYMAAHQLIGLQASKHPRETFKWMEYVLSLEANLIEFDLRGGFMWSKPLAAKIDTSRYPGLDVWMKMPSEADKVWSGAEWTTPISGVIEKLWARAQDEVIYGRKEAAQALADINAELQTELDRANQAIAS